MADAEPSRLVAPAAPGPSRTSSCGRGCGRGCAPGVARSGRPFSTCCRPCARGRGCHSADCDTRNGLQELLLVRVLKANLSRSFSAFGRMDPFAVVSWAPLAGVRRRGGGRYEIATTPTAWDGHVDPVWNHTCLGQACPHGLDGVALQFRVFDRAFGDLGAPTRCGQAMGSVPKLLRKGDIRSSGVHSLPLWLNDERTGTITVQCLIVPRALGAKAAGASLGLGDLTSVEPETFETPVKRLAVSGGTAPFFRLFLRSPGESGDRARSRSYYVGKDLSHAQDEVSFYEKAFALARGPDTSGLFTLLSFTFEYLGVFTCAEEGADASAGPMDMLVLRNLFDDCPNLRMLDVKIGEKTASNGWRGKSWLKAVQAQVLDGFTNCACEGFRLAGFNGPPPSFQSRDPLLDVGSCFESSRKKALRTVFSQMRGAEIFRYLLDTHAAHCDEEGGRLSPSEVAEAAAGELARELAALAMACRAAFVPQKWVGSSVCLAFDAGPPPPRDGGEEAVQRGVRVHIFDWGRSELNTVEAHAELSEAEQHDRTVFWQYYVGGVDRLAWEAARAYHHRFSNADAWHSLRATVYDFDSLNADDFLGVADLPLEETKGERTVLLRGRDGSALPEGASLAYAVERHAFPEGSRLRFAWRVSIVRARKLPAADVSGTSDPYVVLTALAKDEALMFKQQTAVIVASLDPDWGETFEVPVVASTARLRDVCASVHPELAQELGTDVAGTLPHDGCDAEAEEKALQNWVGLLDKVAGTAASILRAKGSTHRFGYAAKPARIIRDTTSWLTGSRTQPLFGLRNPLKLPATGLSTVSQKCRKPDLLFPELVVSKVA